MNCGFRTVIAERCSVFGSGWLACGPVGTNCPRAEPLTIHAGNCVLGVLKRKKIKIQYNNKSKRVATNKRNQQGETLCLVPRKKGPQRLCIYTQSRSEQHKREKKRMGGMGGRLRSKKRSNPPAEYLSRSQLVDRLLGVGG